ncbi:MAG: nitroreductase [Gammaproteobacteria bacterium]
MHCELQERRRLQSRIIHITQVKPLLMKVTEAMHARKTIRNFLDKPVDDKLIKELLVTAARAPSGGNLQPWRVYILNGEVTMRFVKLIESKSASETPEYTVYPPNLKDPYRTSRFNLAEDMYALLDIPREDKPARLAHVARNFRFFDAPAAFFCFVDKIMGPPQWSDLGMFLQSFMLLAQEAGLDTCPQEAWANWPRTVTDFVGAPDELMLFTGMAIGYANPDAPVNRLVSEREPLETWAQFVD